MLGLFNLLVVAESCLRRLLVTGRKFMLGLYSLLVVAESRLADRILMARASLVT
jgi:hypothetical protein